MLDPYDPPHPDGPVDPEDIPTPLSGPSWLDDDDAEEESPRSRLFLVRLDPE